VLLQTLNILVDTAMVIYIYYRFGATYGESGNEKNGDLNVCQKIVHFFCFDVVTLIYIIFLIWHIIWTLIGTRWMNSETAQCKDLLAVVFINIVLFLTWLFFLIAMFAGAFIFIHMALEEGSFNPQGLAYCMVTCMTFGMVNPKGSKEAIQSRKQLRERRRAARRSGNKHQEYKDDGKLANAQGFYPNEGNGTGKQEETRFNKNRIDNGRNKKDEEKGIFGRLFG